MSQHLPDPARWLADLMTSDRPVLWPTVGMADSTKALSAAAEPWTATVAEFTKWQQQGMRQMTAAWTAAYSRAGGSAAPIEDKRFADEAWSKDPRYAALARAYLAHTKLMHDAVEAAPLDEREKAQWGFALRQVTDALSPANMLATNPEALQLAVETGGASLVEGMRLFTEDLALGRIQTTDTSAFEVGRNVGTTPGSVIYQNELIQLIQYTPTTTEVYACPLLIVPPCINKYYILDLQPANSFVAHAVARGHTVFLLSWRSAGAGQETLTWDDYLEQGVLRAIDVARRVSDTERVNTLGFCVGGTLLASALAVRAARGEHPAASLTLLTTMLDFSDTGDIGLLISEQGVAQREAAVGTGGVVKGSELAQVFASLRANDLIWPYVVNSYLKGKPPPAFDLLYWNSDDTNLPGPMFCWYVRNTYLENMLRRPGGTVQCGERVDLGSVDAPAFVYASKEDHIVPWRTAYASTQLLSGEVTFVLGASGHIAGVINPPAKNKRNYWALASARGTGNTERLAPLTSDPDQWLEAADSIPGSWWPAWIDWLAPLSGPQMPARVELGSVDFAPIEEAPGSYVRETAS